MYNKRALDAELNIVRDKVKARLAYQNALVARATRCSASVVAAASVVPSRIASAYAASARSTLPTVRSRARSLVATSAAASISLEKKLVVALREVRVSYYLFLYALLTFQEPDTLASRTSSL